MVAISLSKDLLALVDRCAVDLDTDRSKVIRRAIAEELGRLGYAVAPELVRAPSRIGKGGRPTLTQQQPPRTTSSGSPTDKPKRKAA